MGRASRAKRERRFQPKRYPSMDVAEATEKCGRLYNKKRVSFTKCPTCELNIGLHCDNCKIQITGCFCTAKERMTEDDYKQFVEEVRKRRARESGLILPSSMN